jgi:hypothetical protein
MLLLAALVSAPSATTSIVTVTTTRIKGIATMGTYIEHPNEYYRPPIQYIIIAKFSYCLELSLSKN